MTRIVVLAGWLTGTAVSWFAASSHATPITDLEPNNSVASAQQTLADGLLTEILGSIAAIGDQDFFLIKIPSPGSVSIEVTPTGTTSSSDTILRIWTTSGAHIIADDDSGVGALSLINRTVSTYQANTLDALQGGVFVLSVEEYGNNAVLPAYRIQLAGAEPYGPAQTTSNVVPEPATLTTLLLGLPAVRLARRRLRP